MGYLDWIEKNLSPAGLRQATWGKMYQLLAVLCDRYALDRLALLRQFFAVSCESEYLARLGRIFHLPRWSFETDEEYRERLIFAGFELEKRGTEKAFVEFMDRLFGVVNWAVEDKDFDKFIVGQSAVGQGLIGGLNRLVINLKAVGNFIVGQSAVGDEIIGGFISEGILAELRKFLDWFLAADIEYELRYT